ncbi:MAG TPA: hypothetical protein VN578_02195 [Candidatus Binatia bacterium]|nr:hypothetical protein [Candidatus Binatia bacterium]
MNNQTTAPAPKWQPGSPVKPDFGCELAIRRVPSRSYQSSLAMTHTLSFHPLQSFLNFASFRLRR